MRVVKGGRRCLLDVLVTAVHSNAAALQENTTTVSYWGEGKGCCIGGMGRECAGV